MELSLPLEDWGQARMGPSIRADPATDGCLNATKDLDRHAHHGANSARSGHFFAGLDHCQAWGLALDGGIQARSRPDPRFHLALPRHARQHHFHWLWHELTCGLVWCQGTNVKSTARICHNLLIL